MPKVHRTKSSLKISLAVHQARMVDNKKHKASHEKEQSLRRRKGGKVKTREQQIPFPFGPNDHLLLIGEGNFSFAMALCKHPKLLRLPAANITATTLDTEEVCIQKYPDAREILKELRGKGVNVLFEVDGANLEQCSALKNKTWNRIVWNFPHIGQQFPLLSVN
jgi:25S rRNA (uracil2634-N3)-methyltransferase